MMPPIIEHWIKGLTDPKTSIWQRDNYRSQLEQVRDGIDKVLETHSQELLKRRQVESSHHK